jgi:nucleotide-binding universal stress UspA family protein
VGSARTFIVGFDGSAPALAALRWAIRLCTGVDDEIRVVHAVGLLEHAMHAEGVAALEAAARAAVTEAGFGGLVQFQASEGEPCAVLQRAADAVGADLVVVGTRGASAHRGGLLGSTSLELAEHTHTPLAIVPCEWDSST